jgi:predicted XRE-type DNA-binding protein
MGSGGVFADIGLLEAARGRERNGSCDGRARGMSRYPNTALAKAKPEVEIYVGPWNVLEDMGFPDAEELSTKVRLGVAINNIIDRRQLSQSEAAKLLRISQPKVSALQNYKLNGFSVQRLMQFITALEYDVVIAIRPHKGSDNAPRISVVDAA